MVDGSGSQEGNYHVQAQMHVVVPNIAAPLGALAMVTGVYHAVLDLDNAFSNIVLDTESQDQLTFLWEGQQRASQVFPEAPQVMAWGPCPCDLPPHQ